jgi:Protein of unknown function (DUF2934)
MTAKSKSRGPYLRRPHSSTEMEEKIRLRAYELYEQRGKVDGYALDDWLQAEAEIAGEEGQRRNATRRKPR